jgi:hypothetical protein
VWYREYVWLKKDLHTTTTRVSIIVDAYMLFILSPPGAI